ncbi:TrmB family transcriptional regulator [Bacteroidota bacterium]
MEQELINYGLSEKEAKLYLLCLKTGETTANRLIELSKLPRGTVYDILEKLKSRGLISSIIKQKTTYFSANDPEVLVKDLEEKKTNVQKVIPKLRKLSKTISKPIEINVFEDFAGVKKILDDVLDNCSEVIVMGNERDAREIIKHHPENFRMTRLEKKIKILNLLEESGTARKLKDDKYSEVKHTDELKNSKEVLIIYNEVTAHIIMEHPITTIKISSKEYTKTQRMLFENLWNNARK